MNLDLQLVDRRARSVRTIRPQLRSTTSSRVLFNPLGLFWTIELPEDRRRGRAGSEWLRKGHGRQCLAASEGGYEGRTPAPVHRSGNGWLRRVSPVAPRPREGPLTEPTAGARPRPQERVL